MKPLEFYSDKLSVMKSMLCLSLTPLLVCSGVVFAQPTWDERESFEIFRDEWNAWVDSIPVEQRALPRLRTLHEQISYERVSDLEDQTQEYPWNVLVAARPWNDYGIDGEDIEVVQEEFGHEIDQLAAVAQRRFFGNHILTELDEDEFDQDTQWLPNLWIQESVLDQLGLVRGVMNLMVTRAVYLATSGEQKAAVSLLESATSLSRYSTELPTELGWLVEYPVQRLYSEAIIELLEYEPELFNDDQLARLQQLLVDDLVIDLERVWQFERQVAHSDWRMSYQSFEPGGTNDELREMYLEQIEGVKPFWDLDFIHSSYEMLPSTHSQIPLAPLNQQIAEHDRLFRVFLTCLRSDPAHLRKTALSEAIEENMSGLNLHRHLPVVIDTLMWELQLELVQRRRYQLTNQIAILSIHRHRARHGEWPKSLQLIDPEVKPVPLIDVYSGQLLQYTLKNGRPHMWAFGADRDDDNGRVPKRDPDSRDPAWDWFSLQDWDDLDLEEQATYDGDIVLMDYERTWYPQNGGLEP